MDYRNVPPKEALALPTPAQLGMVNEAGSSSGRDADKYERLGIRAFAAARVDALIPEGVAAWLECRLIGTVAEGSASIVMGEILAASAIPDAWKQRLHYVSESVSYAAGPALR